MQKRRRVGAGLAGAGPGRDAHAALVGALEAQYGEVSGFRAAVPAQGPSRATDDRAQLRARQVPPADQEGVRQRLRHRGRKSEGDAAREVTSLARTGQNEPTDPLGGRREPHRTPGADDARRQGVTVEAHHRRSRRQKTRVREDAAHRRAGHRGPARGLASGLPEPGHARPARDENEGRLRPLVPGRASRGRPGFLNGPERITALRDAQPTPDHHDASSLSGSAARRSGAGRTSVSSTRGARPSASGVRRGASLTSGAPFPRLRRSRGATPACARRRAGRPCVPRLRVRADGRWSS